MIDWRSKGFGFNPILFCNGAELYGWYFWDETWANLYGPYHSHIEAWSQLLEYCKELKNE